MAHRPGIESLTSSTDKGTTTSSVRGFSPIEMLMTITFLGILAATLIPQILSHDETARQHNLLKRLHLVRGRIEQFRDTNDGQLPAEGRNSADDFMHDLAELTDHVTKLNPEQSFPDNEQQQPHVTKRLPPVNPYTMLSEILVIPDRLKMHHYSGNGRHGWAYSSTTGEFRANLSPQVKDQSGRLINQM